MPHYQRKPRHQPPGTRRRGKKGIGQKKDKGAFWAGMMMGAATATGGFFAVRALEKVFKAKEGANANPGPSPAQQRLVASATGASGNQPPPMLAAAAKPTVTKRTIIEEMVEDLDA